MTADLLGLLAGSPPPAFALLHRPGASAGISTSAPIELLVGEMSEPDSLAEIPLPQKEERPGELRHDTLVIIPYRQVRERGFACVDDDEPLLAMSVTGQCTVEVPAFLSWVPDNGIQVSDGDFDVPDETYADIVRKVIANEISRGEGSNFVVKRSFVAKITGYTLGSALTLFRRLLASEYGAYWTFLVHTGDRTFVGASPERHVSLHGGVASMNPISGTYRYPDSGPTLAGLLSFLDNRKETDELYMVVDEELKMMARICDTGLKVTGPRLKEMARLAHTEYFIEGRTDSDPRDILRETLLAPTVTGSPLENACRVISRYEPYGRGYYSGVAALIGRDQHGGRTLDSTILIRTADIDREGRVRIGAGATLVRHSDPAAEVAETKAKVAGLRGALNAGSAVRYGEHPAVRAALDRRNANVSGFWLAGDRGGPEGAAGRRVLVVDAEDTFTAMFAYQLRATGMSVAVRRFDEPGELGGYDLVVLGPGPGDPRDTDDPRIARLLESARWLIAERRPFLAVCLSHQVLAGWLGFELAALDVPNQGLQRWIELFGQRRLVGFYNSFTARSTEDKIENTAVGVVEVSRDPETDDVHALRGPHFVSLQFHAESLLTRDGPDIVGEFIEQLLN
ncbi:anthranilate synthase family protein [Kibdelosporangium aridum]|uniref:anthranilate synthase n=1 Tax=Kibdelosporangium aridum TaxID=2030 RepID=A0A1Y5Y7S1_KIBAR|nr:anthranilate synthase family protein [Kibdelosporangium aridum]SMD25871.1 phenazine biosynthesis protein phzE [Kibdelosporangium aridum]